MSEVHSRKSPLTAWTFAMIILLAPALYVLSVPCLTKWQCQPRKITFDSGFSLWDHRHSAPQWLQAYWKPYKWLYTLPQAQPHLRTLEDHIYSLGD